jgi:hypothetical protein
MIQKFRDTCTYSKYNKRGILKYGEIKRVDGYRKEINSTASTRERLTPIFLERDLL